jgi:phosphatidylserine synthase
VAGALWLLCGLFYLLAAVTRLGFYNVATGDGHHGFVGVPTTMIGFFWSIWLLFNAPPVATAVALVATGAAMISPFRIRRPGARALAVLAVLTAVVLAGHLRHAAGL